jgi:hypothetical protein
LAKGKDAATNALIKQAFVIILSCLITIVGWLIKNQMDSASRTIAQNKADIEVLTRDSLLLKQSLEFRILLLNREITDIRRDMAGTKKVGGD